MKKLITLLFLICSITVFAQERGDKRAELSEDEMVSREARNLAMQLDLNPKQEEKIKALFAEQIEYIRALKLEKDNNDKEEIENERKEIHKDCMEMNEEQKAELKEILTEEQFAKWEQLQVKRHRGRRKISEHREN